MFSGFELLSGSKIVNYEELLHNPIETIPQLGRFHIEKPDCNNSLEMLHIDNRNIDTVAAFFYHGMDRVYETGIEQRCELALGFYGRIKENMGITSEIGFSFFEDPMTLGGFDRYTNRITLSADMLQNADCRDLLSTIVHEARHSFQLKEVSSHDSIVPEGIRSSWKYNFDHYIPPELDYQNYRSQPIEKDAYQYEETIMKQGIAASIIS